MVYKKILNNGLTVVIDHSNIKTCTMKYVVAAGALDESGFPCGIAHIAEHMLFQGTTKRTANDINKEIIKNGGYNNAYTTFSSTALFISCSTDKWKENLEILTDMFWNSVIDSDALIKEKLVIIEELSMYNDDPESKCMDSIEWVMNKNYPNRRSNVGTIKSVKSITSEDIKKFRKNFYQPSNVILIITGNVPINESIDYINQLTCNLTDTFFLNRDNNYFGDILNNRFIKIKKSNLQQTHMAFYIKGVPPHNSNIFVQDLISYILGGHAASRLFGIIRDKLGLTYTITTDISYYRDTSYITGYCIFDYSNLSKVKKIITEQLNLLKYELVNSDELELAKTAYLSTLLLDRESTENQTNIHENNFIWGTDYTIDNIIENINSITSEQIYEFADKYINNQNIIWSAIIPE